MSSTIKRILPTFNRVLVKRSNAETITKGGIVLGKPSTKEKTGTIVAVGPGCTNHLTGVYTPMTVKTGDVVLLPEYGGCEVELDDKQTYEIYSESELMAKIAVEDK